MVVLKWILLVFCYFVLELQDVRDRKLILGISKAKELRKKKCFLLPERNRTLNMKLIGSKLCVACDTPQGYLINQNFLINAIILICNPHKLLVYFICEVRTVTYHHYKCSLWFFFKETCYRNSLYKGKLPILSLATGHRPLLPVILSQSEDSPCHFCFFCRVLAPCWHPLVKKNYPALGNKAKRVYPVSSSSYRAALNKPSPTIRDSSIIFGKCTCIWGSKYLLLINSSDLGSYMLI